jgi:phosphatidylinositol alpha-1,6-mannosyltransferase
MPGNGGICVVARLMARVMADQAAAGRLDARALMFGDSVATGDLGISVRTARSSRLRYVIANFAAARAATHFIYDWVGMARAHWRLPPWARPYMTWIHGIDVWESARPYWVQAARRADVLLCNSNYTRQRADTVHGGFRHAQTCWLATETDEPPREDLRADGPSAPPTVMILGRMDESRYKGHDELIDCWPAVVSAVPDARLLIVGRGPSADALRQKAASSPAAGAIEFAGFVPDEQIDALWRRTSILAMPSRGEGFGLVYIEAMRYGIPVIASIHDAGPEVNLDGQTGYNVNLDRSDELPDRLIHLLRDPSHAKALGSNGHARWGQEFRFSAFRKRFLPLLERFTGLAAGR